MNEVAYEVWRGAMYCVGVFVTCNVGGAALRFARDCVSGLMKRHAVTAGASNDGNAAAQDAARKWNSQSFADIQRELGRGEVASEPDKGADT